jgi:hypothetical protein
MNRLYSVVQDSLFAKGKTVSSLKAARLMQHEGAILI